MDLYAYTQIYDLDKFVKANGIDCPRLRGYRLMKDEEPIDLTDFPASFDGERCQELCRMLPFWSPRSTVSCFSWWTDYLEKFYTSEDKDGNITVRWDRIHGWKRRALKTYIHNERRKRIKSWKVFNKYVGRDDVLYIHARIGGNNWKMYGDAVKNQPWFIEKIDDPYDNTYCDIYAKLTIKPQDFNFDE